MSAPAVFSQHATDYIGEFTIVDDHRGGKIVVELIGRINKCGAISPRFDVEVIELHEFPATHASPSVLARPSRPASPLPPLPRSLVCGAFLCQYYDIEKWIVNLLPSRQFGHIVLTTTFGIMDHDEARRKRTGGKILGFFY